MQCAQALKPGGTAYFQVYAKNGGPGETQHGKSWQEGRAMETYIDEISKHFRNVKLKTKEFVIASDPINSETDAEWRLDAGDNWRKNEKIRIRTFII